MSTSAKQNFCAHSSARARACATDLELLEEERDVVLLQPLVGVVDAQLLEAVHLETLEPVDVQDPCGGESGHSEMHSRRDLATN